MSYLITCSRRPHCCSIGTWIFTRLAKVTYPALWVAAQTVCMALTLPLTVGLLMLLGWNLYLALINRTTIEYHEGVTANVQVRLRHASFLYARCLRCPAAKDTRPSCSAAHYCVQQNFPPVLLVPPAELEAAKQACTNRGNVPVLCAILATFGK